MDFQQLSAQSTAFSITDRIDNWTQEVAKTRRERCLRTKPVHYALRQHNHGIPAKLSKQVLDVTAPAFKRKRKGIMSENDDVEAPKKKRGRPARGSKPATQAPATAAYNNEAPLATPPLEPTPSLPSRRKASPRNNAKYIHQPIASTNINVRYLRLCHPRLHLKSLQDAKLACAVPQSVLELHNRLQSLELGQIPSELKSAYETDAETPRKSRTPPFSPYYLSGQSPYPPTSLQSLKSRVDLVFEDSAWCHTHEVHERQWGSIVNQLLGHFRTWPIGQGFRILNVENCSIEPEEMRPTLPYGGQLPALDAQSSKTKSSKSDDFPQSVGRMVDWCLALKLDNEDEALVEQAFAIMKPGEQSLNQSLSYIQQCPLFLDIEIKKTQSNINPEVQLGIWASAAMLKRKHHGWDLSLPMPGIIINGFHWNYFLIFAPTPDDLIMMGPFTLGSTADLNGVWTIVRRLYILLQWGVTDYQAWFKKEVLEQFRLLV